MQRVADQVNALLSVKAPNVSDQRLVALADPKAVAESLFVPVFSLETIGVVAVGDEPIHLRVPNVVIYTIAHTAKLVAVNIQGVTEAAALLGVHCLPGVAMRDSGEEVGVYDTRFHEVDGVRVEVIAQTTVMEIVVRSPKASCPKHALAVQALMPEVVDRVANALVLHPAKSVDLEQ